MLANRPPPDANAANALAHLALLNLTFPPAVAGVWPLDGEIDLRPLLHALHAAGHRILLPHTPPRGEPLLFHVWTPETPLRPGRFGTLWPDGPVAEPDLLFVPLLAFDRAGRRLGYGGGYYDRTLALLECRPAIGFGYASQEVAAVPVEPHDRLLAAVVTEREFIVPTRDR